MILAYKFDKFFFSVQSLWFLTDVFFLQICYKGNWDISWLWKFMISYRWVSCVLVILKENKLYAVSIENELLLAELRNIKDGILELKV